MQLFFVMEGEMALSLTQIEDDVQILAWGRWARPRIDRMLGTKPQGWTWLVAEGTGWGDQDAAPPPAAYAPEEYCAAVDKMIASMGPETVAVMVSLYCYRRSLNAVARASSMSKQKVMQMRDCALNRIYGALYLKNIA